MTKKEKEKLHSQKCTLEAVDANIGGNPEAIRYVVAMSLSGGELLTMSQLLEAHDSAIAKDLSAYLKNAAERAGIKL
jgi:hypothetical protein